MTLATRNGPNFGRLPSEVRLEIYSYVLATKTFLHFDSGKFLTIGLPPDSGLSILLVCKKFQEEALNIFYQNTDFQITAPEDFGSLVGNIGEMNVRRIRSFKFSPSVFRSTFVDKPEMSKDLLSNVETLEIAGGVRRGALLPNRENRASLRFMQHLQRITSEHPKLRRIFAPAPPKTAKRSYIRLLSTAIQPRQCASPPSLQNNQAFQPKRVLVDMPQHLWAPRHHCPAEHTEEGCPKEIEIVDIEAKIKGVEWLIKKYGQDE